MVIILFRTPALVDILTRRDVLIGDAVSFTPTTAHLVHTTWYIPPIDASLPVISTCSLIPIGFKVAVLLATILSFTSFSLHYDSLLNALVLSFRPLGLNICSFTCQGIRPRPFSSSSSIFSKFPQATQSNLPHTPRAWALLDLSSPVRPSNNLVNPILASHRPAPRHGVDTNIASCLCKPDAAALITGRRLLRHRRCMRVW
jgi:hypothetical protein